MDSGVLLFFILHDTLPAVHPSLKSIYEYAAFYSWVAYPLFYFFVVASIWMMIGVTINRYIMVAFPTKVRVIYNTKNTALSIVVILLFSFTINVPHFFSFSPQYIGNGSYLLGETHFGVSEGVYKYDFWVHCIFLVLAPWFSILVLNILIIRQLRNQAEKFKNGKEHREIIYLKGFDFANFSVFRESLYPRNRSFQVVSESL